jgi:AcrR family transcriptional regulator
MDATRTRILEAAIGLYTERGVSATAMREIGVRADVAPGTLRNHFPSRDALDAAMVERLEAEASLPDRSIFDGADTLEERVGRLTAAAGQFFVDAARTYAMWLREPMLSAPWSRAGAAWGARWDELMRLALGPLADDADAMAVVRAVLHPTFFRSVAAGSRNPKDTARLVAAAISPGLAARARTPAS